MFDLRKPQGRVRESLQRLNANGTENNGTKIEPLKLDCTRRFNMYLALAKMSEIFYLTSWYHFVK